MLKLLVVLLKYLVIHSLFSQQILQQNIKSIRKMKRFPALFLDSAQTREKSGNTGDANKC